MSVLAILKMLCDEFLLPANLNLGYAQLLHLAILEYPELLTSPRTELWKSELHYIKKFTEDLLTKRSRGENGEENVIDLMILDSLEEGTSST